MEEVRRCCLKACRGRDLRDGAHGFTVFFSTMLRDWKCRIGREKGPGRLELGRAVHRYIGYWFVRDDNEVFQ